MKKIWRKKVLIKAGIALVVVGVLLFSTHALAQYFTKASKGEIKAGESRAKALLAAKDVKYPPQNVKIIIYKSKRTLELYADETLIQSYSTVFADPVGHKFVEGDMKTPEGKYTIVTRHRSKFHLFLGVSYPNADDAKAGLARKDITQSEHDAIVKAQAEGKRPPWNTKLGGAIGIHGGGIWADWTAGCIALTNEAIEEIYALAKMGTPVEIYP